MSKPRYDRYGELMAPRLHPDEFVYKHRPVFVWLIVGIVLILLSVVLGISSEEMEEGIDAEGLLCVLFGVMALVWVFAGGMGLFIEGNTSHNVNDIHESRGVRRLKNSKVEVIAEGTRVRITHKKRPGTAAPLWPVFGHPPYVTGTTRTFDATTDEGQEAAHGYASELRAEKPLPKIAPEAKALARTLAK